MKNTAIFIPSSPCISPFKSGRFAFNDQLAQHELGVKLIDDSMALSGVQMLHFKLRMMHFKLTMFHSKLKVVHIKLQTFHFKLSPEHFKLRLGHMKLHVEHFKLKVKQTKLRMEQTKLKMNHILLVQVLVRGARVVPKFILRR